VEFALWLLLLAYPTLNVVDLGFYVFKTMQVRQAAQAGAQTAESICGYNGKSPAATACTSLTTTLITNSVQSTSLGTGVTLSSANEGWYCNNTSGALVLASGTSTWAAVGGTAATEPSSCNATVTGDTDLPGDYVLVSVSYAYVPLLKGAALLNVLTSNSTITQTAYMRIN
jgi:hypothetical protein